MIIIHGENTITSRDKLLDVISDYKKQGIELVRLEAKDLSEAQLETTLGEGDLFGTKKAIIIEGLHSLPKSEKQKTLIKLCCNATNHEIVLWEKRELTATMLKPFPQAQVYAYKASKTLFSWLDLLGTNGNETKKIQLLHDAIETDGDFFCFIMLIRQFRLLIQAKTGEKIAGAPFMISKLQKQAQQFSLEQLLKIHQQLLIFDFEQKTSKSLLSMNQWLDLFTVKL
ncbi:MAG: hypothetical protein BroJett025_02470 [Patescibacteria group bacterium]|nr:MAG: hypothetical protein BroJett025_02470 [Patescibacteria group bacterium]